MKTFSPIIVFAIASCLSCAAQTAPPVVLEKPAATTPVLTNVVYVTNVVYTNATTADSDRPFPATITFVNWDGTTISNATVVRVEKGAYVVWRKDSSGGKVKILDLPDATRRLFKIDPSNASNVYSADEAARKSWDYQKPPPVAQPVNHAGDPLYDPPDGMNNFGMPASGGGAGMNYVNGYYRRDGTYVNGYYRK